MRRHAPAVALLLAAAPGASRAQASYHDLDAGRPTRIEDGQAMERLALDVQLVPLAVERLDDGTLRLRVEPKLALGALPMTQLELRAPFVHTRARGGASVSGLSGIGFGVLRALTIERRRLPALALFGELLVPGNGAAGAPASYTVKGIATKSTPHGRVHLNGAVGSYGLPAPRPAVPGAPPVLPDPPCDVDAHTVGAACMRAGATPAAAAQVAEPSQSGRRWFVALGADRALPLRAMLVGASAYVERFSGPYVSTDWTAELGVRRQLTPKTVFDAGVARRLAGRTRSTSLVVGLTYGISVASSRPTARGAGGPP